MSITAHVSYYVKKIYFLFLYSKFTDDTIGHAYLHGFICLSCCCRILFGSLFAFLEFPEKVPVATLNVFSKTLPEVQWKTSEW